MKDKNIVSITDLERLVLTALDEDTKPHGEYCAAFSQLERDGLDRKAVRRGCRSLRKKGLAEFYRGLMTDDGIPAGAGYCISESGRALLHPCDFCGNYADYEYDEKRECYQHYGSPRQDKLINVPR